ncbi:DUF1385 domain-containing protein [Candidatus Woesearchaeota archaeon]|nr:DUF1385 domain-containing protein [Candidatus Woesearchaeota archaeon]
MKKPTIGGQAVLEGVMLRSPNYYVTSVRNEKGKIITQLKKIRKKPKWFQWPFIRGIVNLIEMLIIGIKSLTWAANQVSDEDEKLSNTAVFLTLLAAIAFAIALFVALPYFLSLLSGVKEESSPVIFNMIDGAIKIIIFLAYLYIISLMKDIRRVFEYHGAEHKTVYAYESGKNLTVSNIKKYSTKHPRCGTSFLFIVVIISIFFFALIPPVVLLIFPSFISLNFFLRKVILFFLRILLIPLIAAVSYELLKLSGRHSGNPVIRAVSYPGILLQHITTKEPDDKQIEVAIKSMQEILKKEKIKYPC